MMRKILLLLTFIVFTACAVKPPQPDTLVLAFGSCSHQDKENQLWNEILQTDPDMFLWLGDAVYPEKYDLEHLEKAYQKQTAHPTYARLSRNVQITGVYDDHDYGMNDGGKHHPFKTEAKSLFFRYMDNVRTGLPDIQNEPAYSVIEFPHYDVRLFILDTRFDRDDLKKSEIPGQRYDPVDVGSILGERQWSKFETDLKNAKEQTIIIISSIQLLNDSHGFEKWGNMPHERQKMLDLLSGFPDKKFIILSGDRHFSEISEWNGITEITASGLTEIYTMADEPNPLRKGNLIKQQNFGLLTFHESGGIEVEIIGDENAVLLNHTIK